MTTLAGLLFDIPMRPSSKDNEVSDLEELFEQYVETGLLQLSDNTAEPSGSDDLAHLFDLGPSNESDEIQTSPIANWDSSSQPWHKALSTFDQNAASPTIQPNSTSIYPESRGKASLSDPEFFQLDDILALDHTLPRRPKSTPSTPKLRTARPSKKLPTTPDHTHWKRIEKPTKRVNFTKMMRSPGFRPAVHDLWSTKINGQADASYLQLSPHEMPASPPPSAKLSRDEKANPFVPREQPYMIDMSSPSVEGTRDSHQTNYQLTPLASPAVDINGRHGNMSAFHFNNNHLTAGNIPTHMSSAALSALQTPPSTHGLPMGTWGPETPAQLDFDFSASPDFQSQNNWWNQLASASGQPSTPYTPHSRSHSQTQNIALTTASVAGLGISCDTASFSGFGAELENCNSSSVTNGFPAASSFDMTYTQAPVFPPSPGGIHIGHPPAPSRSPTHSPIPQPRFHRRRHSSRPRHPEKSRSHKTSSRKSSQSSASHSGKPAQVGGFVNFTPDDSKKILTGVAPSGSSKTKARREKEAADRRRKLSQAAMKAVIDAGGDIKRLEENGLLSLEVE